ncbi:ABC-type Co2+ transport system, permease component [Archaeoglobus sulfaticallidus PM70-1]|uniref:ABC-type Co2+ transport system, permease component n=1 Tax=Archaeoglobus sulfaticallidus PM70-1 TaxID=387631 RepID=N0BMI8_9EURY|nr:energy-coupling factor ABC transporter permease [Archaeoglobus sulfaticallidus]AGK61846.1 ABC-type Co2+ transport system, permease component [Archaeoglobus sulfaticallidus PM70-1]
MHIPDGFLDLSIAGVFYVLTGIVFVISLIKAKDELDEKRVPVVGMVASAIFAAQMLNWPIPGGTSAHFVGGALAGVILGPYAGFLAMASVLIIQTLVFADGGITALGANIWNMGVVAVFVGYYVFKLLEKKNPYLAAAVAGWLGITLAAIFAGIEIGLSSTFKYSIAVTVPVMGMWHGILGIIEGVITAGVVAYIYSTRPDILFTESKSKVGA